MGVGDGEKSGMGRSDIWVPKHYSFRRVDAIPRRTKNEKFPDGFLMCVFEAHLFVSVLVCSEA